MRGRRLREEEVVTLKVLLEKGVPNTEIGRVLGVSEGAVRYHGRKIVGGHAVSNAKAFRASSLAEVIRRWMGLKQDGNRPANVRDLFEHLVSDYDYAGSYKSVLRYVRAHFERPRIRTYRRVETVPGAQVQTDWGEFPRVVIAGETRKLHAFVMVLSHSRMPAVIWSESEDQVAWQRCHNESFRRLRGIAAVNRIDNVKTAVASGAGCWGKINESYRAYARAVGFHVDACQPRAANAKGKVESKVKLSRFLLDPCARSWLSLEELQRESDKRVERWSRRTLCPATGLSVWESWQAELERLAALPILPEPFDVVVTRPVRPDCTVCFESRFYPVPFQHVGQRVEVRGCAGMVQILAGGRVVREYPRHTPERVLVDVSCYEGRATDRVLPPPPLGRMGERLREIFEMPVMSRPIDLYAALAEVAR